MALVFWITVLKIHLPDLGSSYDSAKMFPGPTLPCKNNLSVTNLRIQSIKVSLKINKIPYIRQKWYFRVEGSLPTNCCWRKIIASIKVFFLWY